MEIITEEIDFDFLKKNFQFTFQPSREKVKPFLLKRTRMTVAPEKLIELIGKRAVYYFEKAKAMQEDKRRFKIQDKGILDIYVK